jgi:hypothetical protein
MGKWVLGCTNGGFILTYTSYTCVTSIMIAPEDLNTETTIGEIEPTLRKTNIAIENGHL